MLCTENRCLNPTEGRANNHANKDGNNNIAAETFTFRELAVATKNFRQECLIGEGGFGRVYKGKLERTNQVSKIIETNKLLLRKPYILFSFTFFCFIFIYKRKRILKKWIYNVYHLGSSCEATR